MFDPTPEQSAIVAEARDTSNNIIVTAYAGCSKTTTLELIAAALPVQPALALAFNVKIKKELEKRFPNHFTIMTLNGLGHRAWGAVTRKRLVVDDRKLGRLTSALLKEQSLEDEAGLWDSVRQLTAEAMLAGLVPSEFPHYRGLCRDHPDTWFDLADNAFLDTNDRTLALAHEVLVRSVRESFDGTISYDDQIYMSALFGGQFPRFPLVLVDEAQDLSVLNHLMVRKTAAGRLIVVGDPKQSIYAFRGADHESMDKLRALRDAWTELPLTVTFRCPQRVVARQQEHAPGFTAFRANKPGEVIDARFFQWGIESDGNGGLRVAWETPADTGDTGPRQTRLLPPHNAVLCRNTAPLLKLAFQLIRQRITPAVLGRDIGKGLITLAKKILPDEGGTEALIGNIGLWRDTETANARAAGHESKISGIEDRAESLLAVIDAGGVSDKRGLIQALEDLFAADRGAVTLSTIHRAKGLEWDFVLHLDPWRIPSKYAKRAAADGDYRQLIQEDNLRYVCETRTKNVLMLASMEDRESAG